MYIICIMMVHKALILMSYYTLLELQFLKLCILWILCVLYFIFLPFLFSTILAGSEANLYIKRRLNGFFPLNPIFKIPS